MTEEIYDICVIGGGINGVGIARDASGRGYKTLLLEQKDLASATSSKSTKLIHGGLRYLENYDFKLVRESLLERDRLYRMAPHIIWPLTFILPHEKSIRPFWLIRLGLYLYDFLSLSSKRAPLKFSKSTHLPNGQKAIQYQDLWVEDSRLVILNVKSARDMGATIKTYEAVQSTLWQKDHWVVQTEKSTYHARFLVNAAGPWVYRVLEQNNLRTEQTPSVRLVQGSHIIVDRLYPDNHCFILQQSDKRIVFSIPYEENYTLVGTTEIEIAGADQKIAITEQEKKYLLNIINHFFKQSLTDQDIRFDYAGVRPLWDDGESSKKQSARQVTRDYKFIEGPNILSVFGGKITTYRVLAEQALHKIDNLNIPKTGQKFYAGAWTDSKPLAGGDFPPDQKDRLILDFKSRFPFFSDRSCRRLVTAYGTDAFLMFDRGTGHDLGEEITTAEIDYLIKQEWAKTAEDILERRSKLCYHLSDQTKARIKNYMEQQKL
jgi:glycerol-3-phosphate dehydrogenase